MKLFFCKPSFYYVCAKMLILVEIICFNFITKDLGNLVEVFPMAVTCTTFHCQKKQTPDDNITAHNDAFCPSIGPKGRVHSPFQSQLFREKYKQIIT